MPQGTAIAIVATVSMMVVPVAAIRSPRCCQTTLQSRFIDAASSRTPEMRETSIDAIDAARHREKDQEVDEHRERVDLDRLERLPLHGFRLAHQFRYCDHRSNCRVLDGDRQ